MGEESTDQSCVATSSSPPPHWWELHATSSWANPWHNPNPNPNSNSSCDVDDDASISPSFTNHSALTVDSSRRLDPTFIGSEAASDHHIWSQVFLGGAAGSNGEKVVEGAACDYLKQLESWELTSFNGLMEPKKLLSYGHTDTDTDDHLKHVHSWEAEGARRRTTPFPFDVMGHQIGINSVGGEYGTGLIHNPPTSFADVISFTTRLGHPLIDKPPFNPSNLSHNCINQPLQTTPPTRISGGRGQGMNQGRKKRVISQDNSETVPKKTKQENSSTAKLQVPKVKLADRITALQQIVSPFGKTDTASVLYEAIGYIKFLQEQVQLLSNPYMKINSPKDPWGGMMDRKEKGDARHDLRSRGLCLVPISCTPQVYRENTGSDYWTPAYRGCLYR